MSAVRVAAYLAASAALVVVSSLLGRTRNCRNAVASTYGRRGEEYAPVCET